MANLTVRPFVYGDEQTRGIATTIDAHKVEVAGLATDFVGPYWPDGEQPPPDFLAQQNANKYALKGSNLEVFTTQEDLQAATAARAKASKVCGNSTLALNKLLSRDKRLVLDHHGEDVARTLGLDKKREDRRVAALSYGEQVGTRMRQNPQGFEPVEDAEPLDFGKVGKAVDDATKKLRDDLRHLDETKENVKVMRAVYKKALGKFKRVRRNVALSQESLYRMVGRDDLAERLRPFTRPLSTRPKDPEAEAVESEAAEAEAVESEAAEAETPEAAGTSEPVPAQST